MSDLVRQEKQDGKTFQERLRERLAKKSTEQLQIEAPQYTGPASKTCLLLDVTGSMYSYDEGCDTQRIDRLRKAVRDIRGIRRFDYSDDIQELQPDQDCRDPQDGNNEEMAFEHLHKLGFERVILVTDGGADRPKKALAMAAKTGLKFDVIYIGPQPAPRFLNDLVKQQAGSTLDTKLKFAAHNGSQLLAAKIKGLLGPGTTGTPTKKAIEL